MFELVFNVSYKKIFELIQYFWDKQKENELLDRYLML